MKLYIHCCLSAAMLAANAQAETLDVAWPTHGWGASTPEEVGLDRAKLDAIDAEFAAGTHGYVDSFLIVRHGRIAYERTYSHDYVKLFEGKDPTRGPYNYYDPDWHPFYRNSDLHTMQSVSKSVTSALIGIAVGRGEIPSVDVLMSPHLSAFRAPDVDPRRERMTLKHVLTMTTGIRWDEDTVPYTDPRNNCAAMEASRDWVKYVVQQPLADEPGQRFLYNSGATMLLSHLLKESTGLHAHDYAAKYLFAPLGIEHFFWKLTPTGLADTEGGLYLSSRDLAKFAYLYLRDGVWEGRRILPDGWVAASVRPLVDTGVGSPRSAQYGYQWWVFPYGDHGEWAFTPWGYGGQLALVVPALDMVVVFTGWNIYDRPALDPGTFLERLVGTVRR